MPDPATLVTEFCGLMKTRDAEQLRPYLADDVVYHNQGMLPTIGLEAVIANVKWQMDTFPDYEYKIHNIAANGDVVMTERTDITRMPTGHLMGCPIMGCFVLENGKIKRWTDYWDRLSCTVAGWTP